MNIVLKDGKNLNKKIIAVILIVLFFIVIFMNSFFVLTSGIAYNPNGTTLGTRFYLFGPDSYYNMRICEQTIKNGYYSPIDDPLLNYPVDNKGARPPLFNMVAIGVSTLFGGSIDALGWAMLWLPAIYGALLIFPIYSISKELFNRKVGLISAMLLPIIPAYVSSGHGSALSLFDHDSFLLLLFILTFFFFLKSLKNKNNLFYPIMSGILLAAIKLTWVADELVFVMISIFLLVYLFVGMIKEKPDVLVFRNAFITIFTGFLIALPYTIVMDNIFDGALLFTIFSAVLYFISLVQNKYQIPRYISIPTISIMGVIGFIFIYFIYVFGIGSEFYDILNIIFKTGVYGDKISLTISESYVFSLTEMAFLLGPIIFWIMFAGFILFIYKAYHEKLRPEYIFFIVIFTIQIWLTTTAGRFVNDVIPMAIIFSSFFIWSVLRKVKFTTIKPVQIVCIFFVVMLILPNTYFTINQQHNMEAEHRWSSVCYWLSQQDTELEPCNRPAILTWWDYGFFIVSMGKHPTVADNFQSGLSASSNFFTSTTEKEALSVMIVRIVEGTLPNIPNNIRLVIGNNTANIIENPVKYAQSYNTIIEPEWHNFTDLRVSAENAMYWDAVKALSIYSDDEIWNIYNSVCNLTGFRIKYIGIDKHDLSVFSAIAFTADKGVWLYTNEDDYVVGKKQTKKDAFYDTMCYQLYNESKLKHFKLYFHIDNVKIFKIGGE